MITTWIASLCIIRRSVTILVALHYLEVAISMTQLAPD